MNRPTTCRQPAYDAVFTLIRSLPTSDVARNAVIWRAVTAALDAANVPDCRIAGHDSSVHSDDTGPNVGYRDFSRGVGRATAPFAVDDRTPPLRIPTELLDSLDPPIDLSGILNGYERYADETNAHAAAVEAVIAKPTLPAATTGTDDDFCGSDPPMRADDPDTQWGDCWCTLLSDHGGDCVCEPCRDRHGATGWTKPGLDPRQEPTP